MSNDFSFSVLNKLFPDEASCRKYLEDRLWNNVPKCPHCGNVQKIYRYKDGKLFRCAKCNKQFKVTTGTIYENSNIPLQKWMYAYYFIAASKKGISSIELSKLLGITQKSAWYMFQKIRSTMEQQKPDNQLEGIVEVDETYVGGKRKFGKRGRGSENKAVVFGAVQRKGDLLIIPVKNAKRKTLEPIILRKVKTGSNIMSDEWKAYSHLCKNYIHETVKHKEKQYVREGDIHTNTIEGAWSHLKRNIVGIYHRPSKKYLPKYCAEFEFNYNSRNDSPEIKFKKIIGKGQTRVSYKDITGTQ